MAPEPARAYRIARGWRVFLIATGAALAVGGVAGARWFGAGHELRTRGLALGFAAGSLAFAVLGAWLIVEIVVARIVVSDDAFELVGALRRQRVPLDQIAGRRLVATPYFRMLVLELRPPQRRKIKLALILETDAAFDAWLARLPDLDAAELQKSEVELLADAVAPRTVARVRALARGLNGAALAAMLWGTLYPQPYRLAVAMLMVLPFAALAALLRWPSLLRLDGRRNDAHPQVAAAFWLPGCALGLRALLDYQPLTWTPLVAPIAVGAVLLAVAAVLADRSLRPRPGVWLALLLPTGFYAWGALAQLNALFDRSPPHMQETRVVEKHVDHGRHTSYHLTLAAGWPDPARETDARVSRARYHATAPGDAVTVTVRDGALGVAWFVVEPR
jgi:hypothetical protein